MQTTKQSEETSRNRRGKRNSAPLLQGEELELAIKEELESHTPWWKICHKLHIGPQRIKDVRKKYFPQEDSDGDVIEGAQGKKTASSYSDDPADNGETAAKVFKRFDRGDSPAVVVEDLRLSPSVVDSLSERYAKLTDHHNTFCLDCYKAGIELGEEITKIKYPCSICGEDMTLDPANDADLPLLLQILRKGGIDDCCHKNCFERS
jgi:hypothetical protein